MASLLPYSDGARVRGLQRLRHRLEAAAAAERTVRILYHGGSQPGALRRIRPIAVCDGDLLAEDLASGIDQTFRLDRIEWPQRGQLAPTYVPHADREGTRWFSLVVERASQVTLDDRARHDLLGDGAHPGQRIRLVRDRARLDGPEILAVHLESGDPVGRLSWETSAAMIANLQRGYRYVAFVHQVTGGVPGEPFRGLVLRVVEAAPGVSLERLIYAVKQARTARDPSQDAWHEDAGTEDAEPGSERPEPRYPPSTRDSGSPLRRPRVLAGAVPGLAGRRPLGVPVLDGAR